MYTGKVDLTNKSGVPFALSNEFEDTFMLSLDLEECEDQGKAIDIVNKNSKYKHWNFMRSTKAKLVLYSKDRCGNVEYLVVHKDVA